MIGRRTRHRAAGLLGAALGAACVTPQQATPDSSRGPAAGASAAAAAPSAAAGDSIVLTTDKRSYRAGDGVTLRIDNRTAGTYGFNACTRGVERRDGAAWTDVPDEGRMCTMILQLANPRAITTATTSLPSPLAAGQYRLVLRMSRQESGSPTALPLPSNAFEVENRE